MNITKILSLPQELSMATKGRATLKGQNIIAVASGKGGVGKTWLSISLAHALSKKGNKVLLFDGDLGLANVDIQLGLVTDCDLGSVITGRVPLTQAMTRSTLGFDVIAGRSGSGSLANVPLSRLQLVSDDLQLLSAQYDKVIVDLGAGIEKSVRLFAQKAGTLFVVCSDEPTSLTDAYAFIKIISTENPNANIQVVVNAVGSIKEGERTFDTLLKACEGFLKFSPKLAGIVRRDVHVRESIRSQSSILDAYPQSDASLDVLAISEKIK